MNTVPNITIGGDDIPKIPNINRYFESMGKIRLIFPKD